MSRTAFLLLLAPVAPAHAFVYTGNPDFGFHVDRPAHDLVSGEVRLHKVRLHPCDNSGPVDYVVNQEIDPVAGYTLTIAGGDLCGATFFWADTMVLYGSGSAGAFTIEHDDGTTPVQFGAPIPPAALTPYDVVSGTAPGAGPGIVVTID